MPSEVGVSLTKDYVDGFMLDSKYASECRGHELCENGHTLPSYRMSLCIMDSSGLFLGRIH